MDIGSIQAQLVFKIPLISSIYINSFIKHKEVEVDLQLDLVWISGPGLKIEDIEDPAELRDSGFLI